MTHQEFLDELGRAADRFDWTLESRPGREWSPGGTERLVIQATLKGGQPLVFDPLRAVCYHRTGKSFEPGAWPAAARALAMSPSDAARILAASQDKTWQEVGGGTYQVVEELASMRNLMLTATGALRATGARA
jgi:hypothetical protein